MFLQGLMWKCSVPDSVERLAWGLGSWVKWRSLWEGSARGGLELAVRAPPAALPVTGCPRCSRSSPAPATPLPGRPLCSSPDDAESAAGGGRAWFRWRASTCRWPRYPSSAEPRLPDITNPKAVYPSGDTQLFAGGAVQAVGDSRPPWGVPAVGPPTAGVIDYWLWERWCWAVGPHGGGLMSVLGARRTAPGAAVPPSRGLAQSAAVPAAVRCAWPGSSVQTGRLLRRACACARAFPCLGTQGDSVLRTM